MSDIPEIKETNDALDDMCEKMEDMGNKCAECENEAVLEAAEWHIKYDNEREHRIKLEKAYDALIELYKNEKGQRENAEYKSELYQEKIIKLREKDVA